MSIQITVSYSLAPGIEFSKGKIILLDIFFFWQYNLPYLQKPKFLLGHSVIFSL